MEEHTIRAKFVALHPVMDERVTRLWAGAEAEALGDGGIAIVGRATGLSRTTIRAGREELRAGVAADDVVAVRRPGGGRPRIEDATPEIVQALEACRTRDPGRSRVPVAVDVEEYPAPRRGTGDAGVPRQPAESWAAPARERVQRPGDAEGMCHPRKGTHRNPHRATEGQIVRTWQQRRRQRPS